MQRTGLSPEFFATEYIGATLYWFQECGQGLPSSAAKGRPDTYTNLAAQIRLPTALGKAQTIETVLRLDQALRQRPTPHRLLLQLAFEFPETLATETGTRFLIFLDEFQEITRLSNYPQIDEVLEIFRAILQTQSRVAYVMAGSAITLMERIFHHSRSPLFVHFRTERVDLLTREDTARLARKVLSDHHLPEAASRTLFSWTYGHPFYVFAVADRMHEMALLFNRDVNDQLLREAFVLETLSTVGRIYNLCRYVIEESIARARGQTLLRLVLQLLAQSPGALTITELSHRLKRATGVTRSLLNRLIEVGLL